MEVVCAEDDVLAPEGLLAAALPGARRWPFDGRDVQLLDHRLAAVLLQNVVEGAEFIGHLGFAHSLRETGVQPCSAKDALPRPQRIEAQTCMRRDAVAE